MRKHQSQLSQPTNRYSKPLLQLSQLSQPTNHYSICHNSPNQPTAIQRVYYNSHRPRWRMVQKRRAKRCRVCRGPIYRAQRGGGANATPFASGICHKSHNPTTTLLLSSPRLNARPGVIRNITLLPALWGEKNAVTSSSKNVSPVAPSLSAYAAR
jgi:hypothetical protein